MTPRLRSAPPTSFQSLPLCSGLQGMCSSPTPSLGCRCKGAAICQGCRDTLRASVRCGGGRYIHLNVLPGLLTCRLNPHRWGGPWTTPPALRAGLHLSLLQHGPRPLPHSSYCLGRLPSCRPWGGTTPVSCLSTSTCQQWLNVQTPGFKPQSCHSQMCNHSATHTLHL